MNRILISIGPFDIYWYSFLIVISIVLGIILMTRQANKANIDKSFLLDLIIFLIPIGIIGARLYYVIFNYDAFRGDFLSIFKIWQGGLAIYGAIISCLVFIVFYCKRKEKSLLTTLDLIAPYLLLGQAIGRWGNFINQEAYGSMTTLEKLQNMHIPKFIIDNMNINGIYYEPTFLYESLWCILGFLVLLIIRKIFKYRKKGMLVFSYFLWYGVGRFFIEGLREDSLYLNSFRVSQIVSIILVVVGIIGIIYSLIKYRGKEFTRVTF